MRLEQAQQNGELLLQQAKWREALPFLGCAFETVEILMELYQGEADILVSKLTSLTVLLTSCLEKLECSEHAKIVFAQSYSSLNQLLANEESSSASRTHLKVCMQSLRANQSSSDQLFLAMFEDSSQALH
ncbi:MAG: hypothetical protein GJ680_06105 [Alteromonadaceae bacterium]|nr:hypothetical protein [Alteromonadaceae bacterium]